MGGAMISEASRGHLAAGQFFASLSAADVERLAAQTESVTAPAGTELIHEGDVGDRMYVIERGSVQVYATGFDGGDVVLARLQPGQWFGEQALLPWGTGQRNASVRALEDCRLLAISRDGLLEALD